VTVVLYSTRRLCAKQPVLVLRSGSTMAWNTAAACFKRGQFQIHVLLAGQPPLLELLEHLIVPLRRAGWPVLDGQARHPLELAQVPREQRHAA
jgi:hypothetical protein